MNTRLSADQNLHDQGMEFYRRGDITSAVRLFESALKIAPRHAPHHNCLGVALSTGGEVDKAGVCFENALRLDRRYLEAYLNLGAVRRKQGRFDESADCFRKALKIDPRHGTIHSYLAQTLREQGRTKEPFQHFHKALEIDPNDIRSLTGLAELYRSSGLLQPAMACYERTIKLNPRKAAAHHNLGVLLKTDGQTEKALEHLQEALQLDPYNRSSQHELDAVQGRSTKAAPPEYVKSLFDQYAGSFEGHLRDELDYQVPFLIREALESLSRRHFSKAIDLGCGTGLCGDQLKPKVSYLCGVDLSPVMLRHAESKSLYDRLHEGEIMAFLETTSDRYDLFVAGDTFVYMGCLDPFFALLQRTSQPDAYCIFSLENSEEKEYVLRSSGRYAHHPDYVRRLAKQYGCTVLSHKRTPLRKERKEWVTGDLYVLQYRAQRAQKKEEEADGSILFSALAAKKAVTHPEAIQTILQSGAVLKSGSRPEPRQILKLLTRFAHARNIRKVFHLLHKHYPHYLDRELLLEIGAGEGYLNYLLSLIKNSPWINRLAERIIETEPATTTIKLNRQRGRRMLGIGISELSDYFPPLFTPGVISFNVLDTLTSEELNRYMPIVYDILKPVGLCIHIMSSSIHPHIVEELKTLYPDHTPAPYERDGYIGVRPLAPAPQPADVRTLIDSIPSDLCAWFAQDPGHFIRTSQQLTALCKRNHLSSTPILFNEFFADKLRNAFKRVGLRTIFQEEIVSEVNVARNAYHDKMPGADFFYNQLGVLFVENLLPPKVPEGRIIEKARFFVMIGQK